jgi:hypothetical protein
LISNNHPIGLHPNPFSTLNIYLGDCSGFYKFIIRILQNSIAMKRMFALLGLVVLFWYVPFKVVVNQAMGQRIADPALWVVPLTGNFGAIQLGSTGSLDFIIRNSGSSVLKIKKIEISGDCFTLTDTTSYPFEIIGTDDFAFAVGNSGKKISFFVTFTPAKTGIFTGKLIITYGLYEDKIHEITLTGEGISCNEAIVANEGENWSPKLDTWFKYTADKFSIVTVTSCNPHQPQFEDPLSLYLCIYTDCLGTPLVEPPEALEGVCAYHRWSVTRTTILYAGETIYIIWPEVSREARNGFYFNINVTYPVDGDVCESAIPLTLPVVNHFGTTKGFNDDYDASPCSPFVNYMDGNDKVYTITLPQDGYLTGDILGAYASIHVLDQCPRWELDKFHCKAFAGSPNGGHFRNKIPAGTYYVVISNWTPPQTVDYLLNLSWEDVSAVESNILTGSLNVYPNPASDKITVAVTNDAATDLTLELVNMSGQVVYRNQLKALYSYSDQINVTRFARGVYYLKVGNGKELKINKVIID